MSGELNTLHRWDRWSPWCYAVVALAPLVYCWDYVADLFWFGDDWDLLDQLWQQGFWSWMAKPFAENYTPVFKTAWAGAVWAGGGSYALMMVLNWVTHALNVGLFAWWLRQGGFDRVTIAVSALGLGLTVANIEALAWSTQFSMLIAQLFFFAAAVHLESGVRTDTWTIPRLVVLGLLVSASALSFSRGVLTGTTLAAGMVLARWLATDRPRPSWHRITVVSVVALVPCLVVALVIATYAGGNQHKLGGLEPVFLPAFEFGAYYLMATPLFWLIPLGSWGWRTVVVLGFLKGTCIAVGWRAATANQHRLLIMLLLLDLASAALLGLGRYHTGLRAVTASRYEYISLICTLPFIGICLRAGLVRSRLRGRAYAVAAIVAVSVLSVHLVRQWPQQLDDWANWRGRNTRQILLGTTDPPSQGAIPGIPFLPTERAREIADHYGLH